RERALHRFADALPDLFGIVLDPTGLREVLRELDVLLPERLALEREDNRRRARRSLIDREKVFSGHGAAEDRSKREATRRRRSSSSAPSSPAASCQASSSAAAADRPRASRRPTAGPSCRPSSANRSTRR